MKYLLFAYLVCFGTVLYSQQLKVDLELVSNDMTSVTLEIFVSKTNPESMKLVVLNPIFTYLLTQISPSSVTWTESPTFTSLNNPSGVHISSQQKIATIQNPMSIHAAQAITITSTPQSFGKMTIHSASPINYPVSLSAAISGNPNCQALVYHNGSTTTKVLSVSLSPGGIVVNPTPFIIQESGILNLSQTFIQGYMTNSGLMRSVLLNSGISGATGSQCDTITIALHSTISPYVQVYSKKIVLNITGSVTTNVPAFTVGHNYYLIVKGRNLIETWSMNPVAFTLSTSYTFGSSGQAFGNNLGVFSSQAGSISVMYSSELNSDGVVDGIDYGIWEGAANNFFAGYHAPDLNGDGVVDGTDYGIWEANANNFISTAKP
jgi:hypothetical protein